MLHLIGDGKIKKQLQANSNGAAVWHGWQPETAIQHEIESCDIGIIPHVKCEHTDHTIPHKLFQFWLHRKPVIVSNCNPLKRIVELVEGGLVFESGNVADLRDCIETLQEWPGMGRNMGINGFKAVIKYFNWKTSEKELLKCYE